MKSRFILCMLIIAAATAAPGCIAQDGDEETEEAQSDVAGDTGSPAVPTENLPEGFDLIAVIDEDTPGINMTEDIEEFLGPEDIGTASATAGKYSWAPGMYDAKITIIDLESVDLAEAAMNNYRSQPDFINPPFKGVDRFAFADVNGLNATEIRDSVRNDRALRYSYLWNDGATVILVEGTEDPAESLDLAEAVYA